VRKRPGVRNIRCLVDVLMATSPQRGRCFTKGIKRKGKRQQLAGAGAIKRYRTG